MRHVGTVTGGRVLSELNLTLKGYRFRSEAEYQDAKKELEAIEYIRAKTDLGDVQKVYKLYDKFNGKNTFHTMIGMEFMRELHDILIKSDEIASDKVEGIIVSSYNEMNKIPTLDSNSKETIKIDLLKVRYKNLKIVTFFLVIVVIAMMIIAMKSEGFSTAKYEKEVQDKYAAWAEELTLKEQELKEREALLESDNQ